MTETVSQETISSETLPESWTVTTLGEICLKPQYGWTTKGAPNGSLHLLRTTDVTSGSIDWSTVPFCTEEPADREKYLLQDGDIVVSRAGSVGVSHLVKHPEESVFASYLIRFKPLIDQKFVAYFLKSPAYWAAISESSSGIAMLNVNAKKLQQIAVPLPPLNEQRRIVGKIEELFTKLDVGVRLLEQARAQLKSYRRSALKAAVEGELSREWREAHRDELEPASELLERILQERREKFAGKKYKEPAPPDTLKLPTLPNGWVWSNLGELKAFSLYGPRFSSDDYAESGVLVLRTSDINESGKVAYAKAPKLPLTTEEFEKYKVEVGDLLVTRTGSLGTLAVFNDSYEAIPGAYLIQYRIATPAITSWYIFYLLKSPAGQRALLGGGAGVGRPNLNAPTIDAIPIPLPPLEEQRFIVEEVERRLSVVDKLEATVEANLKQAGGLRQSILKQAFSGELVPQDPDDEPASMLLERVRKERQAAKQKASKKSTRSKQKDPVSLQALELFPKQGA